MGCLVDAPELVQRPHQHPVRTTVRCLGGCIWFPLVFTQGFPGGSMVKNLPASARDKIQSPGQEDPLEKEMATHSRILAWRTPWTEESSGSQSMGSQRVGHDCAHTLHMFMKGLATPGRCPSAYIMLHYLRSGLCVDSRVRHT